MIDHTGFFDEPLRRSIRSALEATGVPADKRDVISDLACHAAQTALESFERIIFSDADPRVQMTAMSLALSLLQGRAGMMLDATKKVGEDVGAKFQRTTLRVQR